MRAAWRAGFPLGIGNGNGASLTVSRFFDVVVFHFQAPITKAKYSAKGAQTMAATTAALARSINKVFMLHPLASRPGKAWRPPGPGLKPKVSFSFSGFLNR